MSSIKSLKCIFVMAAVLLIIRPSRATNSTEEEIEILEDKIFDLGHPEIGGNGCEGAIISTSEGDGFPKLSIIFPDYVAETGQQPDTGLEKRRVRKFCAMSVPITVKRGFSVGIFKVDYRANVYVPDEWGSRAQFSAEYFFAGQEGPKRTERFSKGYEGDITITDEVAAVAFTPCEDTEQIFRINTSILSRKGYGTHDDTFIGIDSADVSNPFAANYHFQYRACP